MALGIKTYDELKAAKNLASEFLLRETERTRRLSWNETVFLHCASHLLTTNQTFYASEITDRADLVHHTVYNIIDGFVNHAILVTDGKLIRADAGGALPTLYRPTAIGAQALSFFQDEPLVQA